MSLPHFKLKWDDSSKYCCTHLCVFDWTLGICNCCIVLLHLMILDYNYPGLWIWKVFSHASSLSTLMNILWTRQRRSNYWRFKWLAPSEWLMEPVHCSFTPAHWPSASVGTCGLSTVNLIMQLQDSFLNTYVHRNIEHNSKLPYINWSVPLSSRWENKTKEI